MFFFMVLLANPLTAAGLTLLTCVHLLKTWITGVLHQAWLRIHFKHRICYVIMYCNLVKLDFGDFKFFPFLLSHKIIHVLYWRWEHENLTKFQTSFNVRILFLSWSSYIGQRLAFSLNHDDSWEYVGLYTAPLMYTWSSSITMPACVVSLPSVSGWWRLFLG